MWLMPSSTALRKTALASSGSSGSPHTSGPGSRIAAELGDGIFATEPKPELTRLR